MRKKLNSFWQNLELGLYIIMFVAMVHLITLGYPVMFHSIKMFLLTIVLAWLAGSLAKNVARQLKQIVREDRHGC